ncbi:MAG: hypothetical protein AB7V43_04645 [Acidimicrobiia bacterium]
MTSEQSEPINLERLVPPRRLGRLLAGLREARGDSIDDVVIRAWGQIDGARLEALESGSVWAAPEELDLLSELYAFEVAELAPRRTHLVLDFDEHLLVAEGFCAVVPAGETVQNVLRRYLTLVWALRGRPNGSLLQLRELDVTVLAEGLGFDRTAVLGLLHEVMEDPTWTAQRGHPSMMSTILPRKIAPQAGILLSAGPEGALIFQSDDIDDDR